MSAKHLIRRHHKQGNAESKGEKHDCDSEVISVEEEGGVGSMRGEAVGSGREE